MGTNPYVYSSAFPKDFQIVDASGQLTPAWQYFFQALWTKTGGAASTINNYYTIIEGPSGPVIAGPGQGSGTPISVASTLTPLMDGAAEAGIDAGWSRGDHVHPSDASKYPVTGGTIAGDVTVLGSVSVKAYALSQSSPTLTIDRRYAQNLTVSLFDDVTEVDVIGWPALGITGLIRVTFINTGTFTVTGWASSIVWPGGVAPVITENGVDIIELMSSDRGGRIYGYVIGQDFG